jgi:hypothetical protein
VVDVHEVHEDLRLQRSLSCSRNSTKISAEVSKAQELAPELATIGEEHDSKLAFSSEVNDNVDEEKNVPTLAMLPPGEVDDATVKSRPASRDAMAPIPVERIEDVSSADWGLDMLVRVGESWAPNLLQMSVYASTSSLQHWEHVRALQLFSRVASCFSSTLSVARYTVLYIVTQERIHAEYLKSIS